MFKRMIFFLYRFMYVRSNITLRFMHLCKYGRTCVVILLFILPSVEIIIIIVIIILYLVYVQPKFTDYVFVFLFLSIYKQKQKDSPFVSLWKAFTKRVILTHTKEKNSDFDHAKRFL